MSQRSISRAVLDNLLPPGWDVKSDSDLDLLLDGLADNKEPIRIFLNKLSKIRNPQKTVFLSDLEKEYGLMTRTNLTEQVRRDRLEVRAYERGGTGSKDNLQTALTRAGFIIQVHENSPAVDPAIFLTQAFQMVAGDPVNAFAGDPNAYCGQVGGELLVNGPIYNQRPLYLMEAGGTPTSYAGDPLAYAGYYLELIKVPTAYEVPTVPGDWPLVFFVGGDATRNIDGELTDIEVAEIPIERKEEFQTIILRYKPVHTWAGLIVIYT